ncbi:BlaI/MecI/CopY family transcriptional regulator [Xylocopilactobacillus apicola]|uniref:Penicillinase repressor n=1 Tax=Xylocopilactobacillus apicola TaxID=2932184 RepID=A0AAU9D8M0_9LACO|nr:BlaI/MecI/CopY family transcriptional regulator [Xylocopilactobacillus apicola]BDR58736.1 hypothetical protein XA3_11770 [Xylocopilactobacillus apicola]
MNKLTRREEDVMHTLWSQENLELTAREIVRINSDLSQNTVQVVLKKLEDKGFVCTTGVTHSGPTLAKQYKALILEEDYYTSLVSKINRKKMVVNLISEIDDCLTIDDIIGIAEKKKKELREYKE